jgi:hypothetical protein
MAETQIYRTGALAAAAATLTALLFTNLINNDAGEEGGVRELIILGAVLAAIGTFLFLRTIPRAIEAGPRVAARRATITGGLAAITQIVFWSGLPFVLAPTAIVMGLEARRRGGGGLATAGIALGVIGLLGSVGWLLGDELSH